MQVLGAAYFGGCFAKPAAVLIHAGIDTHEVGAGQVDGYSEFIHRIAYIKRIKIEIIVWVVVGITPVEAVQYIVAAVAAYIHAVGGQAAAAECELAVVDPLRPVGLAVECVPGQGRAYAFRVLDRKSVV